MVEAIAGDENGVLDEGTELKLRSALSPGPIVSAKQPQGEIYIGQADAIMAREIAAQFSIATMNFWGKGEKNSLFFKER